MATSTIPVEALKATRRGFLARNRWLLLRRASQLLVLLAFLTGPWFGVWIAKGNLSSSLTLGVLPLTDPLLVLQTLATGHLPYSSALIGAAIVLVFYLLFGGRLFCSWVCPVNVVTDAAAWSRTMRPTRRASLRWYLVTSSPKACLSPACTRSTNSRSASRSPMSFAFCSRPN